MCWSSISITVCWIIYELLFAPITRSPGRAVNWTIVCMDAARFVSNLIPSPQWSTSIWKLTPITTSGFTDRIIYSTIRWISADHHQLVFGLSFLTQLSQQASLRWCLMSHWPWQSAVWCAISREIPRQTIVYHVNIQHRRTVLSTSAETSANTQFTPRESAIQTRRRIRSATCSNSAVIRAVPTCHFRWPGIVDSLSVRFRLPEWCCATSIDLSTSIVASHKNFFWHVQS